MIIWLRTGPTSGRILLPTSWHQRRNCIRSGAGHIRFAIGDGHAFLDTHGILRSKDHLPRRQRSQHIPPRLPWYRRIGRHLYGSLSRAGISGLDRLSLIHIGRSTCKLRKSILDRIEVLHKRSDFRALAGHYWGNILHPPQAFDNRHRVSVSGKGVIQQYADSHTVSKTWSILRR